MMVETQLHGSRSAIGQRLVYIQSEMLNVVTKLYIFKYSSIIKGKNVNIS
jgi:hypothetical protein